MEARAEEPDRSGWTYVRLYADDAGESHLEDVTLDAVAAAAEPGVPPLWVRAFGRVDRLEFVEVEADGFAPGWHTGPRRQFVVFLTGWARIETSDGDRRTIPAGGAVLVEDTHGRGHVTTHEPGRQRVLVIPLDALDALAAPPGGSARSGGRTSEG